MKKYLTAFLALLPVALLSSGAQAQTDAAPRTTGPFVCTVIEKKGTHLEERYEIELNLPDDSQTITFKLYPQLHAEIYVNVAAKATGVWITDDNIVGAQNTGEKTLARGSSSDLFLELETKVGESIDHSVEVQCNGNF